MTVIIDDRLFRHMHADLKWLNPNLEAWTNVLLRTQSVCTTTTTLWRNNKALWVVRNARHWHGACKWYTFPLDWLLIEFFKWMKFFGGDKPTDCTLSVNGCRLTLASPLAAETNENWWTFRSQLAVREPCMHFANFCQPTKGRLNNHVIYLLVIHWRWFAHPAQSVCSPPDPHHSWFAKSVTEPGIVRFRLHPEIVNVYLVGVFSFGKQMSFVSPGKCHTRSANLYILDESFGWTQCSMVILHGAGVMIRYYYLPVALA